MKISSDKRINEFLLDIEPLSPEKFEMMILIRDLFFKENKDLVEDIKYGGLVFNLSDNLVGGLFVYKQHISIEFSNGADCSKRLRPGFVEAPVSQELTQPK